MYGQGQNVIIASEYTDDPTLRPELVLDVTYVPESATPGLLTQGGLCLLLRRRRA